MRSPAPEVPVRLLLALALGTVLNPLNSSMIAVALVSLQRDFSVGIATSTWLASSFYLTASVCQPLMGRFADQFGARRLFIAGLALMAATSALAPLAPTFGWLLVARVFQAVATSTAYPSALILIRHAAGPSTQRRSGAPPARALATLAVAGSVSAALGPALGGLLVAVAGWQAVFGVNVPLTAVGIVIALRVLPRTPPRYGRSWGLRDIDVPGIALFAGTLSALIVLVLSFADDPTWWLVPVVIVTFGLLVRRELRVAQPFLDIRGLINQRSLTTVLAQQGGVNLVFYCVFFGMPMWLEHVRGLTPDSVGLMLLPVTVVGLLVIPLTARVLPRYGSRRVLVTGFSVLLIATSAVQLLDEDASVALLLTIVVLLGVPNGLNNLGLQTALYEAAPADRVGASAGLFQTFRYLGAISATSVLGVVLEQDLSTRGMHHVGYVMTSVAATLLLLTLVSMRRHR
ncbi:MFS transporter [Phytoactinopolyspora halotolerans]|uniref:MFS transporter n=1 Tax=Phytoactinopolyspora halotolerans TaxID=1981512 RepID=A0A6L9SD29_9ACTN|nr:MFS transporter [Phytoactinopolyspora halotolerans]NEE03003.1 MFS transporter [Phytoactinopolyspora halotolerans]